MILLWTHLSVTGDVDFPQLVVSIWLVWQSEPSLSLIISSVKVSRSLTADTFRCFVIMGGPWLVGEKGESATQTDFLHMDTQRNGEKA